MSPSLEAAFTFSEIVSQSKGAVDGAKTWTILWKWQ